MIVRVPGPCGSNCAFDRLRAFDYRLSSRQLTGPLNCSVLSDCPARAACMGRIMALLDALETGDTASILRLLDRTRAPEASGAQ